MSDIVGTSVIGVELDDSKVGKSLTKMDHDMQKTLGKSRAMPINILPKVMGGGAAGGGSMMGGTTVPFGGSAMATGGGPVNPTYGILVDIRMYASLIYQTLEELQLGGMQKISAKRGGGGGGRRNAGILSQMGIKGMAPYVRMGGGGVYGGLSGIDLMGTMSGIMGKGGGKAVAGAAGTGAKAAGSGVSAGGAAAIGGASLATAGIVAAIVGIFMVTRKLLKIAKETTAWKFIKTIFQNVVGTFLGIILMGDIMFNKAAGSIIDIINFAYPFLIPFTTTLDTFINFFAEKSLKERIEEGLDAVKEKVEKMVDVFFGGVRSAATYIYDEVVGAGDYIYTTVSDAAEDAKLFLAEGALQVYDWFVDAGDYVKTKVGDAADYVGEKWDAIGTWLQENIITPLKEFNFGDDILTPIKNVFSSIATTLYNAFITYFINPIANVFSSLINYVIGWANKIPGINISKMGNVEFPESDGVFS